MKKITAVAALALVCGCSSPEKEAEEPKLMLGVCHMPDVVKACSGSAPDLEVNRFLTITEGSQDLNCE